MSAIFSNEVQADVTGSVSVNNFPAVQDVNLVSTIPVPVTDNGSSLTVDGTVAVSGVAGTVAVTGPLTDAELRATPVPVSGTLNVTPATAATATVTRVSVSPVVATLAANNPARLKLLVHNEAGTLFVKLGTAASSTDYTFRLTANSLLEVDEYTGPVTATKAAGTTDAQVTEL